MLCLAVSRNGEHLCVAGDPDAIVQADITSGSHLGTPPRPGFALSVTAATGEGLSEWISCHLSPGDEITIRVMERSQADTPGRAFTEAEFEGLADKRGLLLARGTYAALKTRMRVLEQEYGEGGLK